MSIANLITGFLKCNIISCLEMLVKLLPITAILDTKIDDLMASLGICKVQRRRAVEFDILGREALTSG
jgi:hypothetical protein